MRGLLNIMRREAARSMNAVAKPRRATVTSYDPTHYAAKVIIQPEGIETGFLPIGSPWVGPGWGMFCPPYPGNEVDVHFQEGGKNAAYISLRFFGDSQTPIPVPSGECWLVHQSGSFFKLTNNGEVSFQDASGALLVFDNNGSITLTANLIVNGNITATGNITDLSGATGTTMADIRGVYNSHTHDGIQSGTGSTNVPNQQLT